MEAELEVGLELTVTVDATCDLTRVMIGYRRLWPVVAEGSADFSEVWLSGRFAARACRSAQTFGPQTTPPHASSQRCAGAVSNHFCCVIKQRKCAVTRGASVSLTR